MSASIVKQASATTLAAAQKHESPAIDVAYLVNREALSSVFAAQVLAPLSQHDARVNVRLVALTPIGHRVRSQWRQKMHAVKLLAAEKYGLNMTCLTAPPARWRGLWSDAGTLRRWLRREYRDGGPLVLHCRNAGMSQIALDAVRGRSDTHVIFDSRGAEVEEYVHENGLNVSEMSTWPVTVRERYDSLRNQQFRVIREAAHVFCVSAAMQQHLVAEYGLDPQKSTVVPCCPDVDSFRDAQESRAKIRKSLNLQERLVITYCGSMAWYQLPQQALRIFRAIAASEPRAHFLAVTTQPDVMRRELAAAQIDDRQASVLSVPPPDVPQYLAAGDLGLLLRDDTVVNRVASPVKFGEYLAAGLPVIISEGVGDYSDAVRRHRLGAVVSLDDSDDFLRDQLRELVVAPDLIDRSMSARCRAFATEHLSWSQHIPRVASVYHELAAPVVRTHR